MSAADRKTGRPKKTQAKKQAEQIPAKQQPVEQRPVKRQPVEQRPVKRQPVKQQPVKQHTLWSHYCKGDVPKPEICPYSLDRSCRQEEKGCSRLHAKEPWWWQLKDGTWYNFPVLQCKQLEFAFLNVRKSEVDLVPLNPSKMGNSGKILGTVLGTGKWRAHFESMTIKKANGLTTHDIRRLSTPSAVIFKSKVATVFSWFFRDEKNGWRSFESEDFSPWITSDAIEEHYLKEDPSVHLVSTIDESNYRFDLRSMIMKNLDTNVEWCLRRRPSREHHLSLSVDPRGKQTFFQDKEGKMSMITKDLQAHSEDDLPSLWDPMEGKSMQQITLERTSNEYEDVRMHIKKVLQRGKIVTIKRIQNPLLWMAFQKKRAYLSALYGESNDLDIQMLFHVTRAAHIDEICRTNFSFKLKDTKAAHPYGRGVYFSKSLGFLYGAMSANEERPHHLVLAWVIVGKVARGYSTLVRPPDVPNTRQRYNTTVDDCASPKVFVKYESVDCYPQYAVEFLIK